MLRNETRLMESAVALAEELHYSRAARKVRISQPMLTKNIQDLELLLGCPLFIRDRKHVVLSEAGRAYVQQARLSLLYGERAVQAARSVTQGLDVPLHIGRSPHVDPFLVSALLSIQLPLYPRLRIELVSQYSNDLVHELLEGTIDLAIVNQPPESPLLTQVQISEAPFYIAMSRRDDLTSLPELSFESLANRNWILFERRLHPQLYDSILTIAHECNVRPSNIQHVTAPQEAFPFVADGDAVAFLVKAGALLMARNGVTVRPLVAGDFKLKTFLLARADNESKVASELVRAYLAFMMRDDIGEEWRQLRREVSEPKWSSEYGDDWPDNRDGIVARIRSRFAHWIDERNIQLIWANFSAAISRRSSLNKSSNAASLRGSSRPVLKEVQDEVPTARQPATPLASNPAKPLSQRRTIFPGLSASDAAQSRSEPWDESKWIE